MAPLHIPVLAAEVLQALDLQPGQTVIDGTLGLGGHAALMLRATGPLGQLLGFDRDARNLQTAKENLAEFGDRVTYKHESFAGIANLTEPVDAILLDLGFSSVHVDDGSRGFSFQNDGPLDMRYDITQGIRAEDIVNGWSLEELATLFRTMGEDPQAKKIAHAILMARKQERITTTLQLAEIISAVVPRHGRMHPATLVFQALRIAVNNELGEVEKCLAAATRILKPGGRLAVITFHSLEDRLIKQWLRDSTAFTPLTKRPVTATREEILSNPRARSAKLRGATKNS